MGEKITRPQAKAFRSTMSASYDRLRVPTLLARMREECLERHYACRLSRNGTLAPGDVVSILGNDKPRILRGSILVGTVESDDARIMRRALVVAGGILRGTVVDVSALGEDFTVRIAEGDDCDDEPTETGTK